MCTLQDATDIINVEVDRSNLIIVIEALIEAQLKSDIIVFFVHILWKIKLSLFPWQATWRRKLNRMQESLEHDIFRRVEEFDIFVRFPRWSLFIALLFLLLFRSSATSLSRLGTVRSNIAEYRIVDLLGRGIVIAGRETKPCAIVPTDKPLW